MRFRVTLTATFLVLLTLAAPAQSDLDQITSWANVSPPSKVTPLISWLKAKRYKQNYIPEPAPHPSDGPHTATVLTYYNPILALDLYNNKKVFRKGAAMVKEFLSGNNVTGWAVMVKVAKHNTARGDDWVFYETFSATGQGGSYGRGISICTGCHGGPGSVDYLLSTFRPSASRDEQ